MTEAIDEMVARQLSIFSKLKTENEPLNQFADNSLIALGSMLKSCVNAKELGADPELLDQINRACTIWKELCTLVITENMLDFLNQMEE